MCQMHFPTLHRGLHLSLMQPLFTSKNANTCKVVWAPQPDLIVLTVVWQAVTFLVIHQKHKKSLEEITNDLCPVLSVQQLYRISTMYWDDRYNTETVSHEASSASILPFTRYL